METEPVPPTRVEGTHDQTGAGDHDQLYEFGNRLRMDYHPNISELAYARLLVLRSRFEAGLTGADDVVSPAK